MKSIHTRHLDYEVDSIKSISPFYGHSGTLNTCTNIRKTSDVCRRFRISHIPTGDRSVFVTNDCVEATPSRIHFQEFKLHKECIFKITCIICTLFVITSLHDTKHSMSKLVFFHFSQRTWHRHTRVEHGLQCRHDTSSARSTSAAWHYMVGNFFSKAMDTHVLISRRSNLSASLTCYMVSTLFKLLTPVLNIPDYKSKGLHYRRIYRKSMKTDMFWGGKMWVFHLVRLFLSSLLPYFIWSFKIQMGWHHKRSSSNTDRP